MYNTFEPNPTPVTLKDRNLTQAPISGAKTLTSVIGELFAGASRLSGRKYVLVYNESPNTVYLGGPNMLITNAMPLLPGDYRQFTVDPTKDFGLYGGASSASAIRVEEGK